MNIDLTCPNCTHALIHENINITTDLAKCGHCGMISRVSLLVDSRERKLSETPPKGSSIEVTRQMGNTVIFLPKRGVTLSHGLQLLFAIFLLGFVTLWTTGAAQASVFFAMFSIPLWVAALALLVSAISAINETQTLTISKSELTLEVSKPFTTKIYDFYLTDIQNVKMLHMKAGPFSVFLHPRYIWKLQWSMGAGLNMPAIVTGSDTRYFFESANDAEQDWIIHYLSGRLKQIKK